MSLADTIYDSIIIGAGAAGLFCAGRAGQRGLSVLLLDHAQQLGEKIRISGGGRCNFTNLHTAPERFISGNPHFCRSALARFTSQHFLELVAAQGIAYHEKTLGQLFCDGSAQEIIDLLLDHCRAGRVEQLHPVQIHRVYRNDLFQVETDRGRFRSRTCVIATGGLSIPATGASGLGYELARSFGLAVTALRPGLVPLALDSPDLDRYGRLAGVSFDALLSVDMENQTAPRFRESALLTHRGLSGPAILQISSYWQAGEDIVIDLLPDRDVGAWLNEIRQKRGASRLESHLAERLPTRLAQAWAAAHAPAKPISDWTRQELQGVAETLKAWRLCPSGTLGYKKAEVTLGGVDTDALSQRTMQARTVPGLAFIGEVVDVTGWLGGYNFQWAWASAAACADGL